MDMERNHLDPAVAGDVAPEAYKLLFGL
jgi:hypothetical protein